jgi:hypothetical protein
MSNHTKNLNQPKNSSNCILDYSLHNWYLGRVEFVDHLFGRDTYSTHKHGGLMLDNNLNEFIKLSCFIVFRQRDSSVVHICSYRVCSRTG